MISLLDVVERTQKGPRVEDKDWCMGLFRKMNDLVRRYEIAYPGDGSFFNMDESLIERAFQAGVEFLVDYGVHCVSTGRVVRFSQAEVLQALKEAPTEVVVGDGRDLRIVRQRRIEEHDALNHIPGLHAPYTESLAQLAVANYASIQTADFLEGFNLREVDGREIFGMPLEAYAARRQMSLLREGIRKAGRPGMSLVYYPINTRVGALLAPMDPDYGLRRTDGVLLATLPDVRIEHDMLTAAVVYDDYGCFRVGAGSAAVGGFCGGIEGAIVEALARGFAGWMCYHDVINGAGISSALEVGSRPIKIRPDLIWGGSVVCQVFNKYMPSPLYGGG